MEVSRVPQWDRCELLMLSLLYSLFFFLKKNKNRLCSKTSGGVNKTRKRP